MQIIHLINIQQLNYHIKIHVWLQSQVKTDVWQKLKICLKENIEDCDLEDLLDVTLCICNFDDPKGVPWNIA